MPGRHVNDQQVRLYMTARTTRPQATAAAMAGISVATGRRIEHDPRPPSSRRKERDYRTRPDPLADLWDEEVVPMLASAPTLRPITILRELAPEDEDNGLSDGFAHRADLGLSRKPRCRNPSRGRLMPPGQIDQRPP